MQALTGLLIKQQQHDVNSVPATYVAEVHPGLWQTPQQFDCAPETVAAAASAVVCHDLHSLAS